MAAPPEDVLPRVGVRQDVGDPERRTWRHERVFRQVPTACRPLPGRLHISSAARERGVGRHQFVEAVLRVAEGHTETVEGRILIECGKASAREKPQEPWN